MLKICNIQQVLKNTECVEQIVCFGAGKRLEKMKELFVNTELWNKIKYIVDNDTKKWNKKIGIADKEFEIISLNELKTKRKGKFAVIITCEAYTDIVNQLNAQSELQKVDFYCLSHIARLKQEEEALQKKIPLDIKLAGEPLIPKVIHYFWFGGKQLPDRHKSWMESWHKFCPDYEIIEWNEKNYDVTKNNYMYQALKKEKWGFVPDYARLDVIYNYGGIYLDTDVEIIGNIDDLLYQKGFAGFESDEAVNLGSGFGAIKGLPVIKEMMDFYDDLEFILPDGRLNLVASPQWQTKILKKRGLQMNGEYQIVDDLTIYPEKMLNGKSMNTGRTILKPYTRMIHHFDGSWLEKESKDKKIQMEAEMATIPI